MKSVSQLNYYKLLDVSIKVSLTPNTFCSFCLPAGYIASSNISLYVKTVKK